MTPAESAQLARLEAMIADLKACSCDAGHIERIEGKVNAVHRLALGAALFGARPWAAMVVSILAIFVAIGAVVRVEVAIHRAGIATSRDLPDYAGVGP